MLSRFSGQQPSGFPMVVFFVPFVCLSLSACAPKEKISWSGDKDLILQSLDNVSQSQNLSQSNMTLLNQRMLKLERTVSKQESTVASLKATLKQEKMKQFQWQIVQEQENNKNKHDVSLKKSIATITKVPVASSVPTISLAKKLKKIEKDIQEVSAVATRDGIISKKTKEKDLYTSAYLSLKSGRYDEAILSFKDLLEQFPKGELIDQAYYWLGESFLSKGNMDQAIKSFSTLIQTYPKSAKYQPSFIKLAMAYKEKGRMGDAKAVLQRLIDEYPDSRSADHARIQLASLNHTDQQ
ncbi:MAG: tol-pal system protein YbgF [Mariprofundaceae bacterium]|nr:tol-pal system protein YbgF [Mariprofundaceae bacterium]